MTFNDHFSRVSEHYARYRLRYPTAARPGRDVPGLMRAGRIRPTVGP